MTREADAVGHPPYPFTLKIVGGTDHSPDHPEPLSGRRIRDRRYWTWRKAEAATKYWRSRKDFQSALEDAQRHQIAEGRLHPPADRTTRTSIIHEYRKALARQLLTPAWSAPSVAWKRAVLARNDSVFNGYVERAQVEKSVADDLAFLAAHPGRRKRGGA